jgi:hypothetical protein
MELDDLKASWQRHKAEHAQKIDVQAIAADTRDRVMKRDRDFARQQRTQILCGLFCLGIMATWCKRGNPLLANAGLILMLLCLGVMLAGSIILKYRLRQSHPELPSEEFLDEERKKVIARIALLRRNTMWLLIPCMAGFLTWQIALSHSLQMKVAIAVIAALTAAGAFVFYRWKLRKELLPELEAIDRDLEYEREQADALLDDDVE